MAIDQHVIETQAAEDGAYTFRDESTLGTRMQLLFVADTCAAARDAAMAVRAEIDRLDLILNGRRRDSELFALNTSAVHRASPELFTVVSAAESWLQASRGAFSGRLGRIIELWRRAVDAPPDRAHAAKLARAAASAHVALDAATRTIARPEAVAFALDGIAKGWIVDRAFQVARAMPGVRGALVDIGGDVRCGGRAPSQAGWSAGIPDPRLPFDNAPLVATAHLIEHAIATSGRGPRDRRIDGLRYSPTLSPFDGWPIAHHVSTSVIAHSATDADALATALLVLPHDQALALAEEQRVVARIEPSDGVAAWTRLAQDAAVPAHFTAVRARDTAGTASDSKQWGDGWQALATFTAPRRQLIRDPQFRSPYMAMWITDLDNNPIRTLILVGKRADWQKDNFIWWSMNRASIERLVSTRSMSTSGAGVYNVFWDGVDDAGKTVAAGTYVLHVETSRERGQHTYRSLTLDFGKFQRFTEVLPPTEEGGGLRVGFDHY
jgi:thiamine biosynthesis lipoprotein